VVQPGILQRTRVGRGGGPEMPPCGDRTGRGTRPLLDSHHRLAAFTSGSGVAGGLIAGVACIDSRTCNHGHLASVIGV
jgi:hypothetical protein